MLVSHEVPISLLDESKLFNDYDYCLPHLLNKYPKYKEFFKKSSKEKRKIIMDNSVFELGKPLSNKKLFNCIKEIKPFIIIAPDIQGNFKDTVKNTILFIEKFKYLNTNIMAVLQGQTYEEYMVCYNIFTKFTKFIAIPFDIKCFKIQKRTKALKQAYARKKLIDNLIKDKVIIKNNMYYHHLLGCSDPIEFSWYDSVKYNFLTSVDTSCPIILAMEGEKLDPKKGLGKEKPTIKLAESMNYEFVNKNILKENIKIFRRYIK